ncbi:N-acetylmannosamine-6-phosphate 2-epimerase [Schleiferilactobacillus harbinensis]|jgi:N-acylglucosamine-6-phosphate 2-epimerase|uniref:N-acetylmannosamine-6-phosphate 2-epimerase n=1 Tax=Schleiferilactobacillus harbinensis TaxID=304207 RepID=UPI001AAE6B15|nr:N-acetylmannosamine-6-phosphate 2-epimerase [Schleiferilactobacillus harbinensis]MBO3092984.1 N-acetylmannosamine-6-phosphate 2-epimerase [Schleiferilactobacillus harbinensis]
MFKRGALIVSCQALPDEPLYSSFIMGRMALAAKEGGADGIRANTVADITAIKEQVDLPIIGIIKKNYGENPVYITPTMTEVDALADAGVAIMACDATESQRPDGRSLEQFYTQCRQRYPHQLFMADCSTVAEMVNADRLGFDFIAPTLVGYTAQSQQDKIAADDFKILRDALAQCQHPVICEGNIDTPEKAAHVLALGCYAVVVGGAITRPQLITKKFKNRIEGKES